MRDLAMLTSTPPPPTSAVEPRRGAELISTTQPEGQMQPAQVVWKDVDAEPVLHANQVLIQVEGTGLGSDSVVLTFGHASTPFVGQSVSSGLRHVSEPDEVACRVLMRVSMGVRRFQEVAEVVARVHEALREQEQG